MKEKFIKEIKSFLKDFSFDDKNTFSKQIKKQLPDQIVIINNQQIKQSGQVINLQFIVELFGEGYVDEDEFIMIRFSIKQNDKKIKELFESFYFNEIDKFKQIIIQFFQI